MDVLHASMKYLLETRSGQRMLKVDRTSVQRRRKFDALRLFDKVKLIAFEAAITIVFIVWLVREVRHELGYDYEHGPREAQTDTCGEK